jgi:hypothetical protein
MEIEEFYNLELDTSLLTSKGAKPPITPEIWTEEIRTTIRTLEVSEVGLLLLRSIRASGNWAIVRPYWWPASELAGTPRERAARTDPIKKVNAPRVYMAMVMFSPSLYGSRTPREAGQRRKQRETLKESHEVLFHELVHVLRMVSGKRLPEGGESLGGGLSAHNSVEEFIAVLVTNIYASRNRKTTLRGGHFVGSPNLPDEFEGSFTFFKMGAKTFPVIRDFCADNKVFCEKLSKVEAPFNPIKAFFDDPDKARSLSESARAKARDARGDTYKMLLPFFWGYEGFEKVLADF